MAKSKALMSMADIEKQMSVYAEGDRQRLIQTGGNMIGTRSERFSYKGTMIGSTMKATVVGFVHQNSYYETAFDADNISIPGCFALSADGVEMAPPDNAPNRQNQQCDGCPHNVFGSAEIGKGKRCKNQYRLALLADDVKDAREADLAFLTLPPTSIKPWNDYVNTVSAMYGKPTWGVMTEFFFDDVSVEDISGVLTARVDDVHKSTVLLGSIVAMMDNHREQLLVPPDVSQYVPLEAPPKRRAATKRKTAPKKKTAKRKTPPAKKAKSKTDRSKFAK